MNPAHLFSLEKTVSKLSQKNEELALAGVAQWIGHWSVNWAVTGLIPGQGTWLGCRPGPQLGVYERQPVVVSLAHVSLPLFLLPIPSF